MASLQLTERRAETRTPVRARVFLMVADRRVAGDLLDISRGGFLLAPLRPCRVRAGTDALLMVGHHRLGCEILAQSPRGWHCAFNPPLSALIHQALLADLPSGPAAALAATGCDEDHAARLRPDRLLAELLRQLAEAAGAAAGLLVALPPPPEPAEVLARFGEAGAALACSCPDGCAEVADAPLQREPVTVAAFGERRLCLRFQISGGDFAALLQRRDGDPAFGPADIAATAELAERIHPFLPAGRDILRAWRQADLLSHFFETTPTALFITDAEGRLHRLNPAGQRLLQRADGLAVDDGGRLTLPTASGGLPAFLRAQPTAQAAGLPIARSGHPLPYLVEVSATGGSAPGGRLFLLAVRDLGAWQPAGVIASAAFGLTPAETRLAKLLVEGHGVVSAAAALGVSRNTVRTHMKRLYAKTATCRQPQLVQRLSGALTGPGGAVEPGAY